MSDSQQDENNPFQKLAVASVIAPLVALAGAYVASKLSLQGPIALMGGLALCGLLAAGGLFGIIALFGMIKYGPERILVPALVGVAITCVFVVYSAVPAFRKARAYAVAHQASSSHAPPQPAVHLQGAHSLNDARLHFTMDIPEGFKDFPDKALTNFNYCYSRDIVGNGDYARLVLAIQSLHGFIPANQHLRVEDAARQAPRGVKVSVIEKNWRGLKIDGLVNEQPQNGTSTLVYVVQIPLVPSAIQIVVRGPGTHRADIEKLIDDIVGSIDGNTNW